jgi:hypothetical protein
MLSDNQPLHNVQYLSNKIYLIQLSNVLPTKEDYENCGK